MKYLTIVLWFLLMTQVHGEEMPIVSMHTNLGTIVLELNSQKAPKTVANFLRYVKEGFYDNTIFHRVIIGYVIQGGGYTQNYERKEPTYDSIPSESDNGLKNERGTVAMARNPYEPDSATTQFFINLKDNQSLDAQFDLQGEGYTVFARVIESMDVVNSIQKVRIGGSKGELKKYVPQKPVIIEKMTIENLSEIGSFNIPERLSPAGIEEQEADTLGLILTEESTEETGIDNENQPETTISAITENLSEKIEIETENLLTHELETEMETADKETEIENAFSLENDITDKEDETETILTHDLEMETMLTENVSENDMEMADKGDETENALIHGLETTQNVLENGMEMTDKENKAKMENTLSLENNIADKEDEAENPLTHELPENNREKMEKNETKDGKKTETFLSHHLTTDEMNKNRVVDKIETEQPSIIIITDENPEKQTFLNKTTMVSPTNTIMVEPTPPSQTAASPVVKMGTRTQTYIDSPTQLTLVIEKNLNEIPKISTKTNHSIRQRFLFPSDPPSQSDKPTLLPN